MSIDFATAILVNMPFYVWILLVFLVWQGIRSRKTQTLPLWRWLAVPVIFTLTGVFLLAGKPAAGMLPPLVWAAAFAVLIVAGIITGPRLLAVADSGSRVTQAGSIVPLVRNLIFFALQYALAVSFALHRDSLPDLTTAAWAISGGSAGYFAGWSLSLWRQYRKLSGSRTEQG